MRVYLAAQSFYIIFIKLLLIHLLFLCYVHSLVECSLKDHEEYISKSCFVVRRIQSLAVTSEAGSISLGSGKEGSAKLVIPRGAIPQGHELQVRYAFLLDGPFSMPENCDIVSPVLYIDYDTSLVTKPLELHLSHWYAGEDRHKTLTFLKAPHVADKNAMFPFTKYSHGSFLDDEQFAVLELREDLCCVMVAVENTGHLQYPVNCRLHLLKKSKLKTLLRFACMSHMITVHGARYVQISELYTLL